MGNAYCRSVSWLLKVSFTMVQFLLISLDYLVSEVTQLHDFQGHDAEKYGHESRRTRNKE
jgi:hypothetical protein